MQGIRGASKAPPDWWERLIAEHGSIVPAFPGPGVLEMSRVPDPPLVDLEQPKRDVAMSLVNAYITAITQSYGVCRFKRPKGDEVFTIRGGKNLIAAAKKMDEAKIAPIAWCMASIDFYEKYAPVAGRYQPKIEWIYSLKRLDERVDFYSWMEATYSGGRVAMSPTHRVLMRRWRAMRDELYLIAAREGVYVDRERVERIVDQHLPQSTYDDLVKQAQSEYRKHASSIKARIARGEFVW